MPVSQIIAEKLQAAFTPASLTVNDDSAAHAGHAGARPGGETHFSVRIVSEHFTGLSRLERQRAVHAALATPPWFVPDTTRLEELLAAFRSHRSQFALVVDEYGALQGLVTLEDVLAEVIGELPDESQAEQRSDVRRRPDGSYLVDGTVPVRDLNRELDWSLPEEGATTIAGLVIQEAHAIPEPGQRFAFFGYTFEVLRRQRNQITALRVTPAKKTPPPA